MAKNKKIITRELKIGVLVVICLSATIWGFNFMKAKNYFNRQNEFYAIYDHVDGLVEANLIFLNGFKIGTIEKIYFHPDGSYKLMAKMRIDRDIKFPKNSVALIYNYDLMGSKAIEIKLGNSKIIAKNGDTILSNTEVSLQEQVSTQVLPLKKKAEDLMKSVDSVMAVFQYIFNKNARENLLNSFESIKIVIKNIEHTTFNVDTIVTQQRYRINNILSNVESISFNLRNNNAKLTNIITNFSEISDTLAQLQLYKTITKVNKSLDEINTIADKVNSGKGTLGLLVNNDTLYHKLEQSSHDLDLLLEDMRINPHRYVHFSVFGKNPKKNEYKAPPITPFKN